MAANVPKPLLEIRKLTHVYGGRGLFARTDPVRAVDRVDLSVDAGDTLGVVGESGCGKTTLARIVAGLLRPTAYASFRFRGRELGARTALVLRGQVQLVFQDPVGALNPRKNVRHALEMPLKNLLGVPTAQCRERIEGLMDRVNLSPSLLDRYPHELSGGQAQRVGIARALAAEPVLLVLDEPTSALDVSVQAQILKLLRRLREELTLTCLFISHDLAVVEHFCEQVAVMHGGRIIELGTRDQVLRHPREAYTRRLLASVPIPGVRPSKESTTP
jgi:ABC-type glutathione transport system ATPase component